MKPTAIPTAQNSAMAESSRMRLVCDDMSMPMAVTMANKRADSVGDMPAKYPMPNPPNEACVSPPAMNTMRRVTM